MHRFIYIFIVFTYRTQPPPPRFFLLLFFVSLSQWNGCVARCCKYRVNPRWNKSTSPTAIYRYRYLCRYMCVCVYIYIHIYVCVYIHIYRVDPKLFSRSRSYAWLIAASIIRAKTSPRHGLPYMYVCIYVYLYIWFIYIRLTRTLSFAVDRMRGSLLQVSFAPKQVHVSDRHIYIYLYISG